MTARYTTTCGQDRGSALIVTLLVISMLSLLVIEFAYEVRVDASLSNNALLDLQAEYAARSAVNIFKAMLRNDWLDDYTLGDSKNDTPDEDWAQWLVWPQAPPDRELKPIEINDATIYMTVADEDSKINVNRLYSPNSPGAQNPAPRDAGLDPATRNALVYLYNEVLVGVDPAVINELVYILADWLDPDDYPRTQYSGESDYYLLLDQPYVCKNGPLNSIDEMLMLRGYNEKVVNGVEQFPGLDAYLTAYGAADGAVNVNTAPEPVLRAVLGRNNPFGQTIAQSIIDIRQDRYFEGTRDLAALMPPSSNNAEAAARAALLARLKTRSEVFSCDCLVEIGDYQKRLRCVLTRKDGPSRPVFKILMWKELK